MNGRERQIKLKRLVGPQYLVEPPHVEGTLEESQILIRLLDLRPEDSELMHPLGTNSSKANDSFILRGQGLTKGNR